MLIAIWLFILGLCFASFVNALVWRLHQHKDFVHGRSQCVACGHQLAARDLIPLVSWLALRGKCRYCRAAISSQYPIVELIGGLVFALSFVFWPVAVTGGQIIVFGAWLAASIGLLALAVYDSRWMLLPNKILYPTLLVAALGQLAYLIFYSSNRGDYLLDWALSLVAAAGIYLVLFLVSRGRWIGYGDVRLGLVTGTLLHKPALALLMIFVASILGLIAVVPSILIGRRTLGAKLPYGPFLILATFICLLFGQSLIDFYTSHFIA